MKSFLTTYPLKALPKTLSYLGLGLGISLALLIAFISLEPVKGSGGFTHLDKILHFLAYGGLMGLLLAGLHHLKPLSVFVIVNMWGIAIEIAQGTLVAIRTPSIWDALANMSGAIAALIVWYGLIQVWQKPYS